MCCMLALLKRGPEWRLSWARQASIIHYARRITEAASDGAAVLDCVIAIPAFFGPAQRQALVDAAQLAGAAPQCVPDLCRRAACAVHGLVV